jgi:hypothetical protein
MIGVRHPVQEKTRLWRDICKIAIVAMDIADKMAYAMSITVSTPAT